ncbi:MAG: hypothetical protein RMJ87_03875 [Cytophagales bacterium]|nr:hypothetical protein [Bernardetiaceae bacterium]MDW8204146.1 hypothetical protein [Cytophagales bacterium]
MRICEGNFAVVGLLMNDPYRTWRYMQGRKDFGVAEGWKIPKSKIRNPVHPA